MMNTNTNIKIASTICLIMGLLVASFALFLVTRGGGWLSFIFSCPFWSAAIILFLAGFRFYRAALFGCVGAAVVGCVAFSAGFFGPIIFTPNANQGPLLGIFFTGPIGTLVGTVIGLLTAIVMKKFRQPSPPSDSSPAAGSESGEA
ncbi:MAG: hypothetical protein M9910_07510 [Kiritimatiellae bacterium]|nr:hypothetical protein [Kiritimatiellia bacterium]